jgi:hypothetical protein
MHVAQLGGIRRARAPALSVCRLGALCSQFLLAPTLAIQYGAAKEHSLLGGGHAVPLWLPVPAAGARPTQRRAAAASASKQTPVVKRYRQQLEGPAIRAYADTPAASPRAQLTTTCSFRRTPRTSPTSRRHQL